MQKFDSRLQLTAFVCLEMHVGQRKEAEKAVEPSQRVYRVFGHHGNLERVETEVGRRECWYLDSALDAEHVYCQLHRSFSSPPHSLSASPFTNLPPSLGSPQLQKVVIVTPHSPAYSQFLSLTHTHTYSLSLSLSHTHTHTHTHTHSLTHSLTHSHSTSVK